jgi:uncharacterized membrane protein YhaH (DUF805 family)
MRSIFQKIRTSAGAVEVWATFVGLFSVGGRSNRAHYWTVILSCYASLFLVALLARVIATITGGSAAGQGTDQSHFLWIFGALAVVVFPCVLWIYLATTIRRLHDRNKSGWWAIPFLLSPYLLHVIADTETGGGTIAGLLPVGLGLWGFVELGCLVGTYGDNDFGPDPLADRH